jgi:UDPglucose--hexose-1-phosphate uridylyltransferase
MFKKETELRYDLLNNDWIIISPERQKRKQSLNNDCPFCNIKSQEKPIVIYNNGKKVKNFKEWTTTIISNKYPVYNTKKDIKQKKENKFHLKINSGGFHELVVTKEHDKTISDLSIDRIKETINCYKERYNDLKKYNFVKYISIFQNHGKEAGASQEHPHSQILTTPLIDKEFNIILSNFKNYFKENNSCLQCKINEIEKKNKKRIVFENEDFIAFCPFAPKFLFQVVVSPKKHLTYFEEIEDRQAQGLAETFKEILTMYNIVLNKPAYNFYLHSSPCKECHPYFHWYWNFFPRLFELAGFEIGASMEILTITPEDQAKFLRNKKRYV